MKRFHFKLDRILHIKEHLETIAKQKYAVVLQRKVVLEVENRHMQGEIEKAVSRLSPQSDTESMIMTDNYIRGLEVQIKNNLETIAGMEDEIAKRRKELDEAMKERKTMEKMREKSFDKYREEYKKHETRQIDEAAGLAVLRRMRGEL